MKRCLLALALLAAGAACAQQFDIMRPLPGDPFIHGQIYQQPQQQYQAPPLPNSACDTRATAPVAGVGGVNVAPGGGCILLDVARQQADAEARRQYLQAQQQQWLMLQQQQQLLLRLQAQVPEGCRALGLRPDGKIAIDCDEAAYQRLQQQQQMLLRQQAQPAPAGGVAFRDINQCLQDDRTTVDVCKRLFPGVLQ